MKKIIIILICVLLLSGIFIYSKREKMKHKEKAESDIEYVQKNEVNHKDKTKNNDKSDEEVSNIAKQQVEAKKISKKYIDLAFSNKLSDEYEENKEIFSNNMLKQLERGKYQNSQKKEKKQSNEVKDIQIYINSDETTPQKVLFTAIYKNVDKEKKKIIQRRVTGEINFIEEDNKLKIDGSQIIKTAEDDDVKAYE
ncbi:hypothetical protein [Staphylococcus aureus]|uniref:hypothetical protein n=1 Tax=Staphylococcus aureus TaxID=1280 RepID=UPI0021112BB3|nr:hypothetical protein [Staphylococcus aureus]MCQ6827896.1 hypothetical protein [Staphylococcus aureus]HDH5640805.1 hypothetical protein [Staphylococcus aureus]